MNALQRIYDNKRLYALVGVSILFFIIKGLKYSLIGSHIPSLFIVLIIVTLGLSFYAKEKIHFRVLKFWAILIIIWSSARLALLIILEIDQNLTESHLREQFGILQNIISLLFLIIGILVFRQIRTIKAKQRKG